MKLIVTLSDVNQVEALKGKVDGLVVSCMYTQRTNHYFALDELLVLRQKAKQYKLELFILCDIFVIEQKLEDIINFINTLIDDKVYFIFNDYAFLVALQQLNKTKHGIYATSTLVTNYIDFNYNKKWKLYGCFPALEIPVDDLKIIGNNKAVKLFYYGFGKFVMFSSRRKLLTNYFKYVNLPFDKAKLYTLKEEIRKEHYKVSENDNGTYIYHPGIRNTLPVLDDLVLITDYLFLDGTQIKSDVFIDVVEIFREALCDLEHLSLYNQKLKAIVCDLSYDFLYDKTVYRKEDLEDEES